MTYMSDGSINGGYGHQPIPTPNPSETSKEEQ